MIRRPGDERAVLGGRVSFRVIPIVDDLAQTARIIGLAERAPGIGFAMMLRDHEHRFDRVLDLAARLRSAALPGNLIRISNGIATPDCEGVHYTSRQLQSGETAMTTRETDGFHGLHGASIHDVSELSLVETASLDYLVAGPVFAPRSKRTGSLMGLDGLECICSRSPLPVFALGGIMLDNAKACIEVGAYGIAAISLFRDDPVERIVRTLSEMWV